MKNIEVLGRRILTLRHRAGLSQAELSVSAKVAQPTISRVESGEVLHVRLDSLVRIAAILGVTLDYLCGVSDVERGDGLIESDSEVKQLLTYWARLLPPTREQLLRYSAYLAHQDTTAKTKGND